MSTTVSSVRGRLDELEREFAEVEVRLGDPEIHADQARYTAETRRYKELKAIVDRSRELQQTESDLEVGKEMLAEADPDEREMMRAEVQESEATIARLEEEIRFLLLPKDPNDDKNVIIEIRGAEGGEEANLFASDLFAMYRTYASRMSWKFEMLGAQESPMGGYTDVAFKMSGDGIWSHMKHEAGTHRVQRVPVTESQGRIHTSSSTVMVLPEADEIDVELDPNELKIDVYRSSGPGGQSVNTTDSAVRITHLPTGLVVSMQDEKSQIQNRAKALVVLRSRLLKAEQDRQTEELSGQRREQVGSGGRSEKIRTYNFKENRLSDHRIGLTLYKLDRILAGELDEVVEALMQEEQTRRLAEGEDA